MQVLLRETGSSWLPGAEPCPFEAFPPRCPVEDLWQLATPHSSLEPTQTLRTVTHYHPRQQHATQ